jgi:hypothetical protein
MTSVHAAMPPGYLSVCLSMRHVPQVDRRLATPVGGTIEVRIKKSSHSPIS